MGVRLGHLPGMLPWCCRHRFPRACRGAAAALWLGMAVALPAVPTAEDFQLDDQVMDVWETAQGLPQSTVTVITQTRDGYLWLGTKGGLACFDGNRFQVFDTHNTPELHSNHITALRAGRDGSLWIGTADGGACQLRRGQFKTYRSTQELGAAVSAFGLDRDGQSVWIGTTKGLSMWRDGRVLQPSTASTPGAVTSICETDGATSWVLGRDGLCQVVGAEVKPLPVALADLAPNANWQGLVASHGGNLWLFGSALVKISVAGQRDPLQAAQLTPGNSITTLCERADGDLWQIPPGDSITALCERADGDLWIGTQAGELRRLGRNEANRPVSNPLLTRPAVRCMFEDREFNLWIGLDGGGLLRIKPKRVRTYGHRDGLPGEHITGMCPDGERGFWVGCHADGMAHWDNGEFQPFTANGALPAKCVIGPLLRSRDGSLWIGTDGAGLLCWKNEQLHYFNSTGDPTRSAILALAETSDGGLWLGTRDGELLHHHGTGFTRVEPAGGFGGAPLTVLTSDRHGGLWIGTDGHGLYHYSGGQFSRFTKADGLGDNHVRALLLDTTGLLWIGTTGGVSRLKQGVLTNFSTRQGLWDNTISQILADPLDPVVRGQQLWFGSNRGIFRIATSSFEDLLQGKISALEPVAYGRAEGMDCVECSGGFGPAGLVVSPAENPHTKSALLWFATLRGVVRLDVFPLTGRARGISGDHLAFGKAFLHLGPDDTRFNLGDVVAGGNGFNTGRAPGINAASGQLAKFSETYNRRDSGTTAADRYHRTTLPMVDGVFIPDGSVASDRQVVISSTGLTAEFPATTGEAWGLLKSGINPAGMDVFNPSDMRKLGVPMIWLSGNQGITFDLDAIRRATGKAIDRFSAEVCNLHIGPASFHILLDGRVAAKRSGLVHDNDRFERGIVPLDIGIPKDTRFLTLAATDDKDEIGAFNRQPPPVMIEEVRADSILLHPDAAPTAAANSLLPSFTALEIAPGTNRLDLRYSATSLVAAEKVRFRHRLEPLESQWVEAGDRRTANYSFLPPGSYRFVVTACNNDGVWNPDGVAVTLTLQPYFWQQRWFAPLWITSLIVTLATIAGFVLLRRHRRRVRQLQQLHSITLERERIARDIHDDLGAGLTHVSLLSELARGDLAEPDRARAHLDQIFTVTRRLVRDVDEIVWAVNPKNDALEYSLAYICKSTQDFLRAADISCRLDWPECLPAGFLTSSQRHQLYLAVRESLNNVVKHAAASEVRLRLSSTATDITVEIGDNGRGFEYPGPGTPTTRHGLDGMTKRMAAVGGQLSITSQTGHGTLIRLTLPLQRTG